MIRSELNSPWLKFWEVELSRQARVTGNSGVREWRAWTTPGTHGPARRRASARTTGTRAGTEKGLRNGRDGALKLHCQTGPKLHCSRPAEQGWPNQKGFIAGPTKLSPLTIWPQSKAEVTLRVWEMLPHSCALGVLTADCSGLEQPT